jgi:hypothetical protein
MDYRDLSKGDSIFIEFTDDSTIRVKRENDSGMYEIYIEEHGVQVRETRYEYDTMMDFFSELMERKLNGELMLPDGGTQVEGNVGL